MVALFIGALALLAYVYAGYPLLIRCWGVLRPRPPRLAPVELPVCIVVAVHNEAARIERKLKTCLQQTYPPHLLHVLIVSDGSTDGSNELVTDYGDPRVELLGFPNRRGKAACLLDALASRTEPLIVLTDARQELHADAVRMLAEHFHDPEVGAVSGELLFRADSATGFSEGLGAYWKYEKFIRRNEALVDSTIGVTGALYALRRDLFVPIAAHTILDDVAIPMQIAQRGARVLFDPRAVAYDEPAMDAAHERMRKVRTLAGNFQLLALYPQWLNPLSNRLWLQYVSHKVLRLVAPAAMAALLLANLALWSRGWVYQAFLLGQAAFYGAAVLGSFSPAMASRSRIVRLASTFVVLNWFVLLGLREFLVNRHAHLWRSRASS